MADTDLRLSFGAMFIGSVMAVYLGGIDALQVYHYFRHFRKKDSPFVRWMVILVSILDFLHTIFTCHSMWVYLVLEWGNSAELDVLIWPVAATVGVTGLVTFIVQMFYAVRIWRFGKRNLFVVLPIMSMVITRLGSAIATTIKMIQLQRYSVFLDQFRWLFIFGLALSCAIEVLLTSTLCYYLRINRSGQSTMDEIIHRLFMYTISNGVLTTLGTFLAMLFIVVAPNSFLFISLHFIITKSYVNSLLATLNSREALKKRYDLTPVAYQISVDGHSQPRFRRFTASRPHNRVPSGSNDRPIPLSDADNFRTAGKPSSKDVKVHIHVEQEVHSSSAGVEREYSLERSVKSMSLSPVTDDEIHSTLNLSHGA